MAKAKKRKSIKTSYRLSQHHHDASNNLLLIVAGGFVLLVAMAYMLGTDMTNSKPQYQEVEAKESTENVAEEVVTIKDMAYVSDVVTIKAGTTVTWVNEDLEPHSATADDGSFDTGTLQSGEKGSVTFNEAGTYTYYCVSHPYMRGTIVVE